MKTGHLRPEKIQLQSVYSKEDNVINWWPTVTTPPDHDAWYSVWRGHSWSWTPCGRQCSHGYCQCALQRVSSSWSCLACFFHMWDTHTGLAHHHHIDETGSPASNWDLKQRGLLLIQEALFWASLELGLVTYPKSQICQDFFGGFVQIWGSVPHIFQEINVSMVNFFK